MDAQFATAIISLAVGMVLGSVPVYAAWNRETTTREKRDDNLWSRLAVAELDNLRLVEEAQARLIAESGHPSTLRPIATVIDFPRRGGA